MLNIILMTTLCLLTLCFSDKEGTKNKSQYPIETHIVLYPDSIIKSIPNSMIGFNLSYYHDKDKLWEDNTITEKLISLKTKILRYPGGAETGYFHWKYPGCPGYVDMWNSNVLSSKGLNIGQILANNDNMDVDEFFSRCKKIGAEPLLGINILSGIVDNKIDASLEEAKDLLNYCKNKGYRVKYLFLDNEVDHTGSYTHISIERYIEMIRLFSPALKLIDPDIKIIISVIEGASDQKYKTLIDDAGGYFDVIDIHCYYSTGGWGNVEWRKWINQGPMLSPAGISYSEDFNRLTNYIKKSGFPKIKLSALEWNIAPSDVEKLSSFQQALMQAEMFGQFVSSSLEMACVWPLIWKVKEGTFPSVLDQKSYSQTPFYYILKLYGAAMGQNLIKSKCSDSRLVQQAITSLYNDTTWVYTINKSDQKMQVNIALKSPQYYSKAFIDIMKSDNITKNAYKMLTEKLHLKNNTVSITIPAYSFTRLELTK